MKRGKAIALSLGILATWLIPFPKRDRSRMSYPPESEAPDTSPEPELDSFRDRVVRIAEGEIGNRNEPKYAAEALGISEARAVSGDITKLSWCGLFVAWVLRQAGANFRWQLGMGASHYFPRTNDPQPGDVAYIHSPYQHHAIVESVGNELVTTIDGNSTGGVVARRTRPRSEFSAFYDISKLDRELMS